MSKKLMEWMSLGLDETKYLAISGTPLVPQSTWEADWAWLKGAAISVVIFFLAWGLKDLKSRYDKVPELEKAIIKLKSVLNEDQKRRLEDLEDE